MRDEYDFSDAIKIDPTFNNGRSVKVTYPGPYDPKKDAHAMKHAQHWHWKWYASGFNFETNIRDICFDK